MRLSFAAAMLLAGCSTSLSSFRVDPNAGTRTELQPAAGFVYRLPIAELSAGGAVRLVGCPVVTPLDKELPRLVIAPQFKVNGSAQVEQVPGQALTLDYRLMADAFKTTEAGADWHPNGMLKSVNATIEDQGPAVALDVIKTAAAIAPFVVGGPAAMVGVMASSDALPGGSPGPSAAGFRKREVTYVECRPTTRALLETRAEAAEAIEKATAAVAGNAELIGALAAKPAADLTKAETDSLAAAKADNVKQQALLKAATGAIAQADLKLTMLFTVTEPAQNLRDNQTIEPSADDRKAFFERLFQLRTETVSANVADAFGTLFKPGDNERLVRKSIDEAARLIIRKTEFSPAGTFKAESGTRNAGLAARNDGIVYTVPARRRIRLVRPVGADSASEREVARLDYSSPQEGAYALLPFRSGFGEKANLTASFAVDGSLLSAKFGRPVAPAKAVSGALLSAGEAAAGALGKIEERRLSLLEQQVKIGEARQKLVSFDAGLVSGAAEERLKADTALKLAELANIEATQKLADARALTPPD